MMRKTILGITIAFLLVLSSYIVTAPIWYGSGDDTGLVGKWSCEGNFLDSSGQGNNGTQSGGVTITSGAKGRACGFDGVDAYVTIPDKDALEPPVFTFSLWVNPKSYASSGNYAYSFDKYYYGFRTNSAGYSEFLINNGTWKTIFVPTITQNNTWYHYAGTWNGTEQVIYENGVRVANQTLVGFNVSNGTYPVYIGADVLGWAVRRFNGSIDEVRFYNRSLSATEISSLYDTGKTYKLEWKTTPELGGMNDTPAPTHSDETGLVGYWKLNGDATDSSGQGTDGVVSGATSTNNGRWNEAYSFDGTNDFINMSNTVNLNITGNMTISAWINTLSLTTQDIIGKTGGSFTTVQYDLYLTTPNTLVFAITNGTTAPQATKTGIVANQWMHVVGTINGTTMSVYINGVKGTDGTFAGTKSTPNLPVLLGRTSHTSSFYPFNGTIDEVRIYNRSLSADEVKELYLSKGLVGHWKMDADQRNSTSTFDSSGYYNHGLISGATLTNEGRFKEGYKLDGVTGKYIETTLKAAPVNFTMCAWAKQIDATPAWCILDTANLDGNKVGAGIYSAAASELIRFFITNGTVTSGASNINYSYTAYENKWTHICGTYGGGINANDLKLYLDGVNVATGNVSNPTTALSTHYLNLGARVQGTGAYIINGSFDEVRVYNRALSADEILGLYQGTKSNKIELLGDPTLGGMNETPAPEITDETGLVGYWKMDDLTNGNTTDSSGQGNNGAVTGAILTNNGRWNGAYEFNGSDYINFSNPSYFNGNTNMTLSWWAKYPEPAVDYPIFFSKYYNATDNYYVHIMGPTYGANKGKIYYIFRNSTYGSTSGTSTFIPAYDTWHHFVLTYDGDTTKYSRLYIDGVYNVGATAGGSLVTNDKDLLIGSLNTLAANTKLNGTMDEVRIYNRSLSADEVKELYLSKGLVGYWKMDASMRNSTSTFDSSGYYNHGLISGATLTNEGRFKEGYKFDGVNDGIYSPVYPINESGTISAWFIPFYADQKMIVGSQSSTPNARAYLALNGNKISGGIGTQNWGTILGTTTLNNNWYQGVITWNSTTVNLYLNGVNEYSSARSGSIPATITYDIGCHHYDSTHCYTSSYNFNGTIDEVRIYNRALSADEILGLYQGKKTNEFAWWSVTG